MIRQRIVAGLVAGVAVIGLAACGSDSKSSDTTAAKATTTTAEKAAATTAKGVATTTGGDISVPDDTELKGNCVDLQKEFEGTFGSASLDSMDPDTITSAFAEMKSKVPSDLKDDVQTLSDAFVPYAQALKAAGGDVTKAMQDPEVQKALQAMSSPDIQTATANLQKWTDDGCPT